MSEKPSACPECGGTVLYCAPVDVQSPYTNLLPGTGAFGARVDAVVCDACGFMRHFVPEYQRRKLRNSTLWKRVEVTEQRDSTAGG